MLVGVFAGFEDYFFVDVQGKAITPPTASELIDNPIKALCWALQNLLVQDGKPNFKDCQGKPQEQKEDRFAHVNNQIHTLSADLKTAVTRLDRARSDLDKLLALQPDVAPGATDKSKVKK